MNYEEGYSKDRPPFDLGLYQGRKLRERDQRMAAAISAIETRIQQLASRVGCSDSAHELEWALKLLGDIES